MRQAITTKYFGPTHSRGSRIRAKAAGGSITIPYDYSGNADSVHAKAAQALAEKMGWSGVWVAGGLPSEDGNVYVNLCGMPFGAKFQAAGCDDQLGREGEDWFGVREKER